MKADWWLWSLAVGLICIPKSINILANGIIVCGVLLLGLMPSLVVASAQLSAWVSLWPLDRWTLKHIDLAASTLCSHPFALYPSLHPSPNPQPYGRLSRGQTLRATVGWCSSHLACCTVVAHPTCMATTHELELMCSSVVGVCFPQDEADQLQVLTSTLRRTQQKTAARNLPFPTQALPSLSGIEAGICDGISYEEAARRWLEEYAARAAGKLRYR